MNIMVQSLSPIVFPKNELIAEPIERVGRVKALDFIRPYFKNSKDQAEIELEGKTPISEGVQNFPSETTFLAQKQDLSTARELFGLEHEIAPKSNDSIKTLQNHLSEIFRRSSDLSLTGRQINLRA